MNARCPVCYRPIEVTEWTGIARRHNDKAGRTCPMTGHHLPIEDEERRSA